MSIKKLAPHQYSVDLNSSNMEYISKIVLEVLLENLEGKCAEGELLHFKQIEEKIRAVFPTSVLTINEQINNACDQAIEQKPSHDNRKNLFGRALIQKIITSPDTKPDWLEWFKEYYLNSFLEQVRISMGIQNFDYFNELLAIALQNEFIIRDMEQAHINWDAFFSHKRVTLMLTKAKHLRQWICTLDNQDTFLNEVNKNAKEGVRHFSSQDLWHILDSWEYEKQGQQTPRN